MATTERCHLEPNVPNSRKTVLSLVRAIVTVCSVAILSACAFLIDSNERTIIDALVSHEASGAAALDLNELVPGDWTQLTIVCPGSTQAQLRDAIGVDWSGLSEVDSVRFGGLMIFSTSEEVEHVISFGEKPFLRDMYFITCGGLGWEPSDFTPPIVVPRSESTLHFLLDDETFEYDFWYMPVHEVDRLRGLDD